jgi:hypothetical protein
MSVWVSAWLSAWVCARLRAWLTVWLTVWRSAGLSAWLSAGLGAGPGWVHSRAVRVEICAPLLRSYVRPVVLPSAASAGAMLHIVGGRHPVLDAGGGTVIPNDVRLGCDVDGATRGLASPPPHNTHTCTFKPTPRKHALLGGWHDGSGHSACFGLFASSTSGCRVCACMCMGAVYVRACVCVHE